MSLLTSVLTGGVNNHTSTSEEINAVFTDFASQGIVGTLGNTSGVAPATGGFAVNATGTPDTNVQITAGVGYVAGTPTSQNSQKFRVKNTATYTLAISTNSSGSTKYDWVYIKLDANKLNGPNLAGDDVATLVTSRSSSSTVDDGTPPTYGYNIAVVTVANGFSTITNGNIRDTRIATGMTPISVAASTASWTSLGATPSSVVANGNRNYTLTFTGTDLTASLSAGMRLQLTRTVAAPTQSTSLNGTTQYYSKSSPSGMTFTNNFVVSAWVKLASYNGATQTIASRYNGTSGWQFQLASDGRVQLIGENAGAANSSYVLSQQSIPLNKWVHVAAQLDMSTFTATTTTSYVMIDGLDVPATVARGGTNPTALVQAGNLEVGSQNAGTLPLNGKIAQVAIYSAKVTQATILASISQTLAGTETSLISAYSFNNVITDLNTSNANNLTANSSAVATNADSPFGGQADGTVSSMLEYAEILSTTFSTNTTTTVRCPGANTIPTSGGVSAVLYSTQASPYGFPGVSRILGKAQRGTAFTGTATTFTNIDGLVATVVVPTGGKDLIITFSGSCNSSAGAGNNWTVDIYDTTNSVEVGSSNLISVPVASFSENTTFVAYVPSPAAGTHTYQARYIQSGAGTFTCNASATGPTILLIESAS